MARSQNTFNKKEREKKKLQKRKAKEEKRAEKRDQETSGKLDDMMAYLDADGNIVDTPPDENEKKKEIKAKDIEIGIPKAEPVNMDAERRGKVAFFNDAKGYGFIDQSQTQERFFVHASSLKQPIQEGDSVKFNIEKGEKGFNAVNVQKVS